MAQPANVDLVLVAGDDETVEVTITTDGSTPVNITGRTYAMQVRADPAGVGTAECVFTCTAATGTDGKVTCVAADTQTDNLTPGDGYWYDLVETVGTTTTTLIRGRVTAIQKVTK